MSSRLNLARRQSIEEGRVVAHGVFPADRPESQSVNFESQRLAGLASDFQHRIIGDDFTDACVRWSFIAGHWNRGAAHRHLNMQRLQVDMRDKPGAHKKVQIMSAKGELLRRS